jgi:hypothetical protein
MTAALRDDDALARDAELWRLHQAEELLSAAGYVKHRDGSFRKPRPSSRAGCAARALARTARQEDESSP